MLHEFRSSPAGAWICAGCGRHFNMCVGIKPQTLAELMLFRPEPTPWYPRMVLERLFPEPKPFTPSSVEGSWTPVAITDWRPAPHKQPTRCDVVRRLEELVAAVALRRLEANDDPERRAVYESWAAYDAAMAKASYPERDAKSLAEVCQLERWHAL